MLKPGNIFIQSTVQKAHVTLIHTNNPFKDIYVKILYQRKPGDHELLWTTPCISEFRPHCYDVSVMSISSPVGGLAHSWDLQRGPSCSLSWGSERGSQSPTLAVRAVTKFNIDAIISDFSLITCIVKCVPFELNHITDFVWSKKW